MKYAKYAKVFVIVGVAFTLVTFLFFLVLFGSARTAWGAAMVVGAVFGAIGAGIIFWADEKRREAGEEVDDWAVKRAENTVEVPKSLPEAIVLCKSALKIFPGARVVREGTEYVVARVGPSGKSLGEVLEFAAVADSDKLTRIGVGSKPAISWLPLDFGKNAENVKRLSREIERRATKGEGFTLIEVLVVVAIAGLILAAAAVNLFPGDREVARRESGLLALAIEGARDDAWFGGRPVAVSVAESRFKVWRLRSDRSWDEDRARERALGEGLKVTALHVEGERLATNARIVFLPDGFGVSFRMAVEVRGIGHAIEGDAAGAVRLAEASR